MHHVFVYRFTRFGTGMQVALGVLAALFAVILGLFIPLPPLPGAVLTILVIAPLSIVAVVWIASDVQGARNTIVATRLDAVLDDARNADHEPVETPSPDPSPVWEAALARIGSEEERVLEAGRIHCTFLLKGVLPPALKGKPERAFIEQEIEYLTGLHARHSGVDTAQAIHRTQNRIRTLVGQAVTGVDIAAMRAVIELDREFVPFTDCQAGHWNVHNLGTVYTAPGGQRRVSRDCPCGSRWSEKI